MQIRVKYFPWVQFIQSLNIWSGELWIFSLFLVHYVKSRRLVSSKCKFISFVTVLQNHLLLKAVGGSENRAFSSPCSDRGHVKNLHGSGWCVGRVTSWKFRLYYHCLNHVCVSINYMSHKPLVRKHKKGCNSVCFTDITLKLDAVVGESDSEQTNLNINRVTLICLLEKG